MCVCVSVCVCERERERAKESERDSYYCISPRYGGDEGDVESKKQTTGHDPSQQVCSYCYGTHHYMLTTH